MSENKEDFALHCLVKNEEARKRLGIKAGFFWTTAKKLSVAVSRCIAAMDDKGYDEDDFKKPVRVNLPVVNDLPPEGVFDTEFCNRYEKGGEDGKTMILIPGAASGGTDTEKDSNNDECQDCEVSVATLPLPQRFLHIFTYAAADKKYLHHATRAQRRHIIVLEMEQENSYIQNLLMGIRDIARLEKQDNADMLRLTDAIKTVFSVTKNHQPREFKNFISAWLDTEHIDRGLLVKEWVKGNRVSHITRTASGANAGGGNLTDRGEGFVHDQASLERDVAMGVLARAMDVDIYTPHPAHEKRIDEIIAENKPPFSVFRDKFIAMPGGRDYSRAIVVASVKEAPIGIEVIPAHVTEYLNKVLTETDHTNPDPLIVDIACGRTSQPMPVQGSANDDEEEPQSAGALADEPATPEAVEQDTTEHHPDPQPLENEPPVSRTEAGYQKIRAELHEARKNIPPKNPGDVGKQLAAARGEYVEGISDPNDPKWVHNDYSASNEGEKTEVATDNSVSAADTADYVDHSEDFSNQHEPETCHSEPAADQNEPEMPQTEPEPQYFEPGRYEGVPNDIYHAANGISSTMVKDARVSLMYYEGRHVSKTIKKERSKVLDMGNLVHVLALQPEILDAEFSIEPEIPEGALTTTATIRAVIDEYNASLTPQLSADEIKTLLEEYNSSLPAPVPLGGDKDAIGIAYLELPDDFKRIVGDDKNFTVSTMKACIKEYNATLPPQVKTSGNRDALLEQLAIINPDLVAQEAQKPQPLKVSGAKADLIQAVKSVKPDAVFADELLDAWRENPGNKILVTRQQYETALTIQSALYAHPEAGKLLQNPTRAVEVSYFGIDDDTGLDIRVRPDVELEYEGLRIGFDLKTISMWDVKEDSLKSRLHREITMRDYHLSAGMYCNVADLDKFAWIFVNKDEGYHWVAVVWASDSLLELGKLEYRRTIRAIANAMDTGEWPAPVTADYTDELNDYDLRRLEALREMA
ncbi:DNA breaking-rejoining protein [Salmonella enterica subsp. enterica serovar Oranienburg]|nr:DNA breaking-rejoining protein [Salmonella enterica]EDT8625064.1 DNA breaking-rejoining protein [Salmonella enterica subsp. enterica serovar Oranienburg]ECC7610713.1 DNA breaking-rejoining protein [Salmonella enterica]EDV5327640.1 DNA breaking-rejoining protein [Salmonella enterica subsp. enterica serovar Oranienburg]EEM3503518.1 DNA breaking-rejoining protein [Salmonella enterica]